MAMARSKLDEHKLREVDLDVLRRAEGRGRPVRRRAHPHDALDPGRGAVALTPTSARSSSPATTSSTRRRSTASRPTSRASPSSGARACCCCAATRRTATGPGSSPSEKVAGPNLEARLQPLQGPHRRDVVRVEHPPRAAGRRRRRGARAQGLPRRALDAQEHEHRPLARAHQRARGDHHPRRASSTTSPTRSS